MEKMRITIPIQYFEKHKKEFQEAYNKEFTGEEHDLEYLIDLDDAEPTTEKNHDDSLWISVTDGESGINCNMDITDSDLILKLIEIAVKKLNKMKTAIETVL